LKTTQPKITAIYGSPRRKGNTAELLQRAVQGASDEGARVEEIVLRDLKMSPCLEIYGCMKTGRCAIKDDFQEVYDTLLASQGLMLASPIFFYTVSAHTKILMDRCQSLWVKKYWVDKIPAGQRQIRRKGLFISVGATKGKKLFDGSLLTVRYFFDVLDTALWKSLLYRQLDFEGDVLKQPQYLAEAYETGKGFVNALRALPSIGERNTAKTEKLLSKGNP
jgi:multimeric flavodoxin WrbA